MDDSCLPFDGDKYHFTRSVARKVINAVERYRTTPQEMKRALLEYRSSVSVFIFSICIDPSRHKLF
jgi:hypothetical protein